MKEGNSLEVENAINKEEFSNGQAKTFQQEQRKSLNNLRVEWADRNKIVQKEELQYEKQIKILVISQVHRNRIDNQESVELTNNAIKFLNQKYNHFTFLSCYQDQFPDTKSYQQPNSIDYILTIGNNTTLMYSFYKFQQLNTPPILAFSVQGQSTLFNFTKCELYSVLQQFLKMIKLNQIEKCLENYSKIQFIRDNVVKNCTCEIQINRGLDLGLVKMKLYLKNNTQQEQIFISRLWGDGLVISTSYGSVSRGMVLNGPIIHKKIESIILIPVCPLSLKFRPIVLPTNCDLIIQIEEGSRSGGTVYIDGVKTGMIIKQGERIIIRKSQLKTKMISNLNGSYEKILFQNLQNFLSWGEQFSSLQYKKSQSKKHITN